ncbi:MAG: NYN domain-containing protein [Burkholderiaceae bacterium]|jgi:uncharacterized LabA/DUF88 family protein/cold shock CspA family protein|nr:NYN domain-containing protein [Burkholderiaceae bacterium]
MSNPRLGIFYDGSYFDSVSLYYKHQHPKKSGIRLGDGFNNFIRHQIAEHKNCNIKNVELVESHFFQGWLPSADTSVDRQLYQFQKSGILINNDIKLHHLPMGVNGEKGIDVLLALECFEIAVVKNHLNTVCLVAGDSDFVPLVRKLREHDVQVMVLGWNFSYTYEGKEHITYVSKRLLDSVMLPFGIDEPDYYQNIASQTDGQKSAYDGMFLKRSADQASSEEADKESPEKYERLSAVSEIKISEDLPPAVTAAAIPPSAPQTVPDFSPALVTVASEPDQSEAWHAGVIHNTQIRYGFITPAEGGENLYFSCAALIEGCFHQLFRDQKVLFKKGVGKNGTIVAVQVKPFLGNSTFSAAAVSAAPTTSGTFSQPQPIPMPALAVPLLPPDL